MGAWRAARICPAQTDGSLPRCPRAVAPVSPKRHGRGRSNSSRRVEVARQQESGRRWRREGRQLDSEAPAPSEKAEEAESAAVEPSGLAWPTHPAPRVGARTAASRSGEDSPGSSGTPGGASTAGILADSPACPSEDRMGREPGKSRAWRHPMHRAVAAVALLACPGRTSRPSTRMLKLALQALGRQAAPRLAAPRLVPSDRWTPTRWAALMRCAPPPRRRQVHRTEHRRRGRLYRPP